ncbi:MAG: hypothetical protein AAB463_00610 [Patescibacteria group bacterium]
MPVSEAVAITRRECYKELGRYAEGVSIADDLEFILRIGTTYKLANMPEILLKSRVHPGGETPKKLKALERATLDIRKKYSENPSYPKPNIYDWMYNIAQYISMHVMSPNFRIQLFRKMRDTSL